MLLHSAFIMQKKENKYINRELSWLYFNERVLQEATDPSVPLFERLKFLGIFSSNQDEFFRVRVATNKRLLQMKKTDFDEGQKKQEIKEMLAKIQSEVARLQKKFDIVYFQLLEELKSEQIYWLNEKKLSMVQLQDIKKYFKEEILSTLFPLILNDDTPFPNLRDAAIYLAVRMYNDGDNKEKYALVELPKTKNRFFIIPSTDGNSYVIFLDDVIRLNLHNLFSSFNFDHFEAYTIKITRDAELNFDVAFSGNMFEKMKKVLKQRKVGNLVRFVHDKDMPPQMLKFFIKKLHLQKDSIHPGQRYHNFKDLIKFPNLLPKKKFVYPSLKPIPISELDAAKSLFAKIAMKDFMMAHPYQSFDYVVRFLREAALDPSVHTIRITLYRVAEHSNVVNALINAVKNGKKVIVLMELKARFDEESNLYWSDKLVEAGAQVFFGYEKLKVHSKVCLVYRKEGFFDKLYAHIGTGNYNGITSKQYCDLGIFTSNPQITNDLEKVFELIDNIDNFNLNFQNILVAPINLKSSLLQKIEQEIQFAKQGKTAWIRFKMNSLVDFDLINKLYEASCVGVKISLIVRGICCLVPGVKGMSDNIEVISIIDKYLEHTRIYWFCNNSNEQLYTGSADLMTRNLEHRVEVVIPILDTNVLEDIKQYFLIQWADNCKARVIDQEQKNNYRTPGIPKIRAQEEYYAYLQAKYTDI